MTLIDFRLQLTTVLSSELGRYKRPNNTTIPALWVGEILPSNYKLDTQHPKLLECIITSVPLLEQIKEFTVRSTQEFYRVTLKDWSSVHNANQAPQGTSNAMRMILENFDCVGTPVPIPATREFIETYSVTIRI